ncbi:MAG: hypothetical protein MRY83_19295 [Flavobacteriales bacterium]|nr:hypothetical protein [Flavobacteriales bacterium]
MSCYKCCMGMGDIDTYLKSLIPNDEEVKKNFTVFSEPLPKLPEHLKINNWIYRKRIHRLHKRVVLFSDPNKIFIRKKQFVLQKYESNSIRGLVISLNWDQKSQLNYFYFLNELFKNSLEYVQQNARLFYRMTDDRSQMVYQCYYKPNPSLFARLNQQFGNIIIELIQDYETQKFICFKIINTFYKGRPYSDPFPMDQMLTKVFS